MTTEERGVDLVVDVAGPSSLNESIACARRHGTIVAIGVLTMQFPPEGMDYATLLMKQVHLRGLLVGPRKDFEELLDLCAANQIHPVLSPETFTFPQLKEALRQLQSQKHIGKIIIKVE
ncbi:hypothetical protein AGDE_15406 [Angomonas deanei]|uniref:Zinc-binding dehydrogenase, putative n=1 Tax=Angomonas deanei TaxID=59799 RepID=A0A7G2CGH2_9TRYP|nr:hypothetical protein AGDE_15406 [Angomonas deanei]CAD2218137.1 Zinc-binding dehydrogenase, putative [Angomonas deanei]|eukprot:EPY19158.1 hypothetical protein AGDE_15406 [Angomonas deanei]